MTKIFDSPSLGPQIQANSKGKLKGTVKSRRKKKSSCPKLIVVRIAWGLLNFTKWHSVFILDRLVEHKTFLSPLRFLRETGARNQLMKGIFFLLSCFEFFFLNNECDSPGLLYRWAHPIETWLKNLYQESLQSWPGFLVLYNSRR